MTQEKKISTMEADKKRLLDALRELKKDGVTLIDDRIGRPAVISAKPRTSIAKKAGDAKSTQKLMLDSLDRLFVEEGHSENDPYNRRLK